MDTSKEYIEMCRKAEEMQDYYKEHTVELGDFYWHRNNGIGVIGNEDLFDRPGCIAFWLPRQDQLQDMVWHKKEGALHPVNLFDWIVSYIHGDFKYYAQFLSPEQVLLAWGMLKEYNKWWNSEKGEWEKIS